MAKAALEAQAEGGDPQPLRPTLAPPPPLGKRFTSLAPRPPGTAARTWTPNGGAIVLHRAGGGEGNISRGAAGSLVPRRQSEFPMADPSSNIIPAPIAHLPTVRIVNLRPQAKGTLRAFVDLELTRIGLVLRDCAWHRQADGREWIGLPSKPYQGADGVTRWKPTGRVRLERFRDAPAVSGSGARGDPRRRGDRRGCGAMSPEDLLRQSGVTLDNYAPGRYYTTCPNCSAGRSTSEHRREKVLGVTIEADGSVRFGC